MTERQVGVQLIIFGKRNREDLAGVLDDVAAAGYQGVETGFLAEQVSGREFRTMLEDRGLVHVGCHTGAQHLDRAEAMIDWLGETGGTELPVSDNRLVDAGLDRYARSAEELNAVGEKAREAGISVSYHNHSWEFVTVDGKPAIEHFYEQLDPALVGLCIDVYWVRDGGVDPATFVARYADRLRILHAKDSFIEETGQHSFAPVGDGVLDFPAIVGAIETSSCPWIVVEQDKPDHDRQPAECITMSRDYLRKLLGH